MDTPPPLLRDQRKADAEHLRVLMICHYVLAGLSVLGIGFLALHYLMMSTVFNSPEVWKDVKGGPPPAQLFAVFKWFYLFGAVMVIGHGVLNLISAGCLKARRHRTFSLVVSGLNCIFMPIGTTLGVFTFIVLLRDSVKELYDAQPR